MKSIAFFSILWSSFSFYLYWPFFLSIIKKRKVRDVLLSRIYGAVIFGGIPMAFLLFKGADIINILGLKLPSGPLQWHIISISLMLICFPASFYLSRSPSSLKRYPQIRSSQWNLRLILLNSATWMIYLVGYEILFRGFLLFPLLDEFTIGIAIVINLGVYSLSHAAIEIKEGIGALPVGLILFFLAWKTDSILYPILFHWVMALSNSFFSVHHQPGMRFVKSVK